MYTFKNKKIILAGTILMITITIAYLVYGYFTNFGYLNVTTNPENTSLIINGNEYKIPTNVKLKSGKYEIIIKKDGYEEHQENVQITKNKTSEINITLKKKLSETEKQLLSQLPIENYKYKIDYEINNSNNDVLYKITLYGILNNERQINSYYQQLRQYKQETLTWLKDQGTNIDEINIEWNPEEAKEL